MPRAQALRRLLWRVNGVLGLLVLVSGARILFFPVCERPLPTLEYAWGPVGPREPQPSVTWEELVREGSRYFPMEPPPEPTRPTLRPAEEPTRPPLAAYDVRMWVRKPGEPDLVVLACKDPAHPRWHFPMEGRPDGEFVLEGIGIEGEIAHITVSRGDERFTYPFPLRRRLDMRLVQLGPTHERGGEREPTGVQNMQPTSGGLHLARGDVKGVPFYGPDGAVAGIRVTGVRPGGAFERMGLRRGDIVLRCGDALVTTILALQGRVRGTANVTVRRAVEGRAHEMTLDGA